MTVVNGANDAIPKDEAFKLLRKAEKGDKKVLPALREWLDANPSFYNHIGNLARQAQNSLIQQMSGKENLGLPEIMQRKLDDMHRDIAGPEPSPLELLLAERVVMCWLHLYYAETVYIQNMDDLTIRQAEFHQNRITKTHNRYLSAIRTLAQVRRLGVPTIQVNVAEQQVNVAQ